MASEDRSQFVRIDNVVKNYRAGSFLNRTVIRAVDGVSLSLRRGQTLGLVGESGSGKSTLGRILAGLEGATAGTVEVNGRKVDAGDRRALRHHWRNTQMVFQDPYSSLNPQLTIREVLLEPLRNFGVAKGESAEMLIRETIKACGLPTTALDRYPASFSGGQRQRVGIARALILKPAFIIADEPVSALDVSIQAQIVNLMQDLKTEFGLTYLFIAHDLALVRHVSDRIAVMYRGRVVEFGDAATIYDDPQHPYTRLLISSIPIPDVQRERQRLLQVRSLRKEEHPRMSAGCTFAPRCPIAIDRCFTHAPALKPSPAGQIVACHLAPVAGAGHAKEPLDNSQLATMEM